MYTVLVLFVLLIYITTDNNNYWMIRLLWKEWVNEQWMIMMMIRKHRFESHSKTSNHESQFKESNHSESPIIESSILVIRIANHESWNVIRIVIRINFDSNHAHSWRQWKRSIDALCSWEISASRAKPSRKGISSLFSHPKYLFGGAVVGILYITLKI